MAIASNHTKTEMGKAMIVDGDSAKYPPAKYRFTQFRLAQHTQIKATIFHDYAVTH